jgi:hypothetical protein
MQDLFNCCNNSRCIDIDPSIAKILFLITCKVESIKGLLLSKLNLTLKFLVNSSQYHVPLRTSSSMYQYFGILLGHVVSKQGLLDDPAKLVVIVEFPPPTSVRQLRATLGHT